MTCVNCPPQIEKYGADPANVQWTVVRGDTARLKIEFFEIDESTPYDTDGWTYAATAYNPVDQQSYVLDVEAEGHSVAIIALPEDTELWGVGAGSVVGELSFDLEVTIPDSPENTIWTPVIGTICVLGDITGGSL
jgi:hypothetical protein